MSRSPAIPKTEATPRISVLMPTYEDFSHVQEGLASLYAQTYPHIELLITDDGSSHFPEEALKALCAELAAKRSGEPITLRILRNEHGGTVRNLNAALRQAQGAYIFFLAADDAFYAPDVLARWVAYFQKTGARAVTCIRVSGGPDGPQALPTPAERVRLQFLPLKKLYNDLCIGNYISGSCTAYEASLLRETGFFDEAYTLLEDFPKFLALLRQGERIHFLDMPAVRYGAEGVSSDPSASPLLWEDHRTLLQREISPHCRYAKIVTRLYGGIFKAQRPSIFAKIVAKLLKNWYYRYALLRRSRQAEKHSEEKSW